MTTHAHLAWTASSLGAGFGATWVQRQDPVSLGWWDVGMSLVEAHNTFDDYEPRRAIAEWYRVLTESNLGVRSVALAPTQVTVAGLGDCLFEMVSNVDPTINGVFPLGDGIDVSLPDNVTISSATGRDVQMLSRSSEKLGEDWSMTLELTNAVGPDLWRPLVEKLRRDLPYVCILSPWGHRWLAGHDPKKVKTPILARAGGQTSSASLSSRMVEVSTSPVVASF